MLLASCLDWKWVKIVLDWLLDHRDDQFVLEKSYPFKPTEGYLNQKPGLPFVLDLSIDLNGQPLSVASLSHRTGLQSNQQEGSKLRIEDKICYRYMWFVQMVTVYNIFATSTILNIVIWIYKRLMDSTENSTIRQSVCVCVCVDPPQPSRESKKDRKCTCCLSDSSQCLA